MMGLELQAKCIMSHHLRILLKIPASLGTPLETPVIFYFNPDYNETLNFPENCNKIILSMLRSQGTIFKTIHFRNFASLVNVTQLKNKENSFINKAIEGPMHLYTLKFGIMFCYFLRDPFSKSQRSKFCVIIKGYISKKIKKNNLQ